MIHKLALVALLAIGLFGGANACCPPTPIFGWVTDNCTGEPINRVKVQTEDDTYWTDALGYFIVNANGNYDLKILKAIREGYEIYRTEIRLNCGVPILHNIELTPEGGCEPEPYCGNEICELTTAYAENCSTCPQDCGECEEPEPYCGDGVCSTELDENCLTCELDCGECEYPMPYPEEETTKSTHRHCDHCFFVGGLAKFYDNMLYGWYYQYAQACGIDYDHDTPPQNIRWECRNKRRLIDELEEGA